MTIEMNNTVRAEALALAPVSASVLLDREDADAVISQAIVLHGGEEGCAAALAQEFGEHPELAVQRMRWASAIVGRLYG
ncbi:hypothetical protein [Planomonospora sp. ID82291]|uniref:hypothetical protein n=1 Tax=Planomonospora sp. ID82291 TaxID=2738136 RepID=UPI0018C39C32|nr:hypothetical protein [Planomonospora sp. ID82291]MBG0818533.1 hypothetical protein [Planomonospora sp. ID82291]